MIKLKAAPSCHVVLGDRIRSPGLSYDSLVGKTQRFIERRTGRGTVVGVRHVAGVTVPSKPEPAMETA
jgi:hypothetical protein